MTTTVAPAAGGISRPVLSGFGGEIVRGSDHRIVLTGASGWLGMATLELLHGALGPQAFADRVHCFGGVARTLRLRGGIDVAQQPLAALKALERRPTFFLHHAFLTKDRAEAMDDAAYVSANHAIRDFVLGILDAIGAEALFVPSSGAARHADDGGASAAMRLYGGMKRDDEAAFAAWAQAHGRPAAIVRVFNIAGPYINKHAAYALAGFILDAQAGQTLHVRAPRRVLRSYVAIAELMSIVMGVLGGRSIERFDTAGDEVLEMADVAERVARQIGQVAVERAPITDMSVDDYVGDGVAYRHHRMAMRVSTTGFDQQIAETATYLAGLAPG